jgi:hypothetical protein
MKVNACRQYSLEPRIPATWHQICAQMVEKKAIRLFKSCRGLIGLQLLYLSLGSLQFKNLEKNGFKQS